MLELIQGIDLPKLMNDIAEVVGLVVIIINAIIAIAMLIPGAEPEATLKKVVDFISKFSKKKA